MRVRPLRNLASHLRAFGDGAIHREWPECAEEGTIEQGAPAGIENAARPASAGDEVPDADILGIGLAAVFAGMANDLGLHP